MPRINLGKVVGPQGEQGPQGADGKAIEISTSATHIQWRYVGDTSWKNLIPLSDLQGEQGIQGEQGEPGVSGARGEAGTDGKSAFQAAVEAGYAGSEADFGELLASVQVVQTHPTAMSPHFQCYKSSVWGSSGTIALPLSWSDVVTETETATLLVEIAEEINISNSTLKVWIEEDSAFASVYGLDGDNIRDAHFVVGSFIILKPIRSTTPVRKFYLLNGGTPSSIFTEALSEHDASDTAHRAQFLALASNKASSQRVDELEREVALKANITDVYSKTEADNKYKVMVVTATRNSNGEFQVDKGIDEILTYANNGGAVVVYVKDYNVYCHLLRFYQADQAIFTGVWMERTYSFTVTRYDGCYFTQYVLMASIGGTFTGTVKAPTAAAGTNNTQIATTAFVQTAVNSKDVSAEVANAFADKITYGTTDLTAGTSPLATGKLYFVYE